MYQSTVPYLARREGFEPPELLHSTVFKTAAIDHSTISAYKIYPQKPSPFPAKNFHNNIYYTPSQIKSQTFFTRNKHLRKKRKACAAASLSYSFILFLRTRNTSYSLLRTDERKFHLVPYLPCSFLVQTRVFRLP